MAGEIYTLNDSMKAAGDYSDNQYYFVRITDEREVTVGVTTEGDPVYGVLVSDPVTSQPCAVAVLGVTRVVAAEPITAGEFVMSTTDGKAIEATSELWAAGIAREDGGTNEQVSIFLLGGYVKA